MWGCMQLGSLPPPFIEWRIPNRAPSDTLRQTRFVLPSIFAHRGNATSTIAKLEKPLPKPFVFQSTGGPASGHEDINPFLAKCHRHGDHASGTNFLCSLRARRGRSLWPTIWFWFVCAPSSSPDCIHKQKLNQSRNLSRINENSRYEEARQITDRARLYVISRVETVERYGPFENGGSNSSRLNISMVGRP